jgi:hypothetical protein
LPLLSAGTIATVAATATTAPVPSTTTAATAAYSLLLALLPLCFNCSCLVSVAVTCIASVTVAAAPPLLFLMPLPP